MSEQILLTSKRSPERKLYAFPYTLPVGVTISSAIITSSLYSGTDAAPSALVFGSASIAGAWVSQMIIGGVAGAIYELMCTAVLSNSEELKVLGHLAITA